MANKPKYRIKKDDVHIRRARPSSAANDGVVLASQRVYGTENSIMFAERGPGYHTRPHRHAAEQMNYIVSGEIWFPEIDERLGAGDLFGEIGLFSLERRRTQTAIAKTDVDLLWINDAALKKLCERNPGLSLYFLRLTATRMTQNAARATLVPVSAHG